MNKNNQTNSGTGEGIISSPSSWSFKGISNEFQSHISKSVPLYSKAHELVTSMTDYFVNPKSIVLDIGCSTGNLISSISARQKHIDDINFYLIDEIPDMIEHSKKNMLKQTNHKYNFLCENIINYEMPENIDIIISMFTIQFTPPSVRQNIVNNIYKSLSWGGAFFFFEKINGEDARFHDLLLQNYEDYKLSKGYTLQEIKSKQLSLRGVLKPFSTNGNLQILKRAGFVDIQTIFQYGLFKGFLIIK